MLTPEDYDTICTLNEKQFALFCHHAPTGDTFLKMRDDFNVIENYKLGSGVPINECIKIIEKYPNFKFYALMVNNCRRLHVVKLFCGSFSHDVKKLDKFIEIINDCHDYQWYSNVFCEKQFRFYPNSGNQIYNKNTFENLIPYDENLIKAYEATERLFAQ